MGQARRVIVTKDDTTIINEGTEERLNNIVRIPRKQIVVADENFIKRIKIALPNYLVVLLLLKLVLSKETEMKDKKLRLKMLLMLRELLLKKVLFLVGDQLLFI